MSERGKSSAVWCGSPSSDVAASKPHSHWVFRRCYCCCCASPSRIYSIFFSVHVCRHGWSVSVMDICFPVNFRLRKGMRWLATEYTLHTAVISVFVPETILFVWINMVWCLVRVGASGAAQERARTTTLHCKRYGNFRRLKFLQLLGKWWLCSVHVEEQH